MRKRLIGRAGRVLGPGAASLIALAGCANHEGPSAEAPARDGVAGPDAAIANQLEQDVLEVDRLRAQAGLAPMKPKQVAAANESGSLVAPAPRGRPDAEPATLSDGTLKANDGASIAVEERAPARVGASSADGRVAQLAAEFASALGARAGEENRPLRELLALGATELAAPGAAPLSAYGSLPPHDQEIVGAWRDLVRSVGASADGASATPEQAAAIRRALDAASERLAASEPMAITRAALCSKVDGFGRYTEHGGSAMLAGKKQRAIVYIELDRFTHRSTTGPDGEPGFAVELTQDLSLYHDADGLLAWRRGEQAIADFSRNKRRDFFIVQMIDLPETLSIGKYVLKVRVQDKSSGAQTETSIPIQVVAQGSLADR